MSGTSALAVAAGAVLLALAISALIVRYRRPWSYRRPWKRVLRATVRVTPETFRVSLTPRKPQPADLMAIVCLFAAKVHWLLATEPPESRPVFISLLSEGLEGDWAFSAPSLESITSRFVVSVGSRTNAVFRLQLFRSGTGSHFFRNTLPADSSLGSWWKAFFALLSTSLDLLPPDNRRSLQQALSGLSTLFESEEFSDADLGTLLTLYSRCDHLLYESLFGPQHSPDTGTQHAGTPSLH